MCIIHHSKSCRDRISIIFYCYINKHITCTMETYLSHEYIHHSKSCRDRISIVFTVTSTSTSRVLWKLTKVMCITTTVNPAGTGSLWSFTVTSTSTSWVLWKLTWVVSIIHYSKSSWTGSLSFITVTSTSTSCVLWKLTWVMCIIHYSKSCRDRFSYHLLLFYINKHIFCTMETYLSHVYNPLQ